MTTLMLKNNANSIINIKNWMNISNFLFNNYSYINMHYSVMVNLKPIAYIIYKWNMIFKMMKILNLKGQKIVIMFI
jgi:hypothetical protein